MTQFFDRNGTLFPRTFCDGTGKPYGLVDRPCTRCGGAGGSDKWAHTGWTCFDCGGNGKHKNGPAKVKLYTVEENARLDAAQAKRNARKAAAAAEAAAREAERRERERAEIISAHADILAKIQPYLADARDSGPSRFLVEMNETITVLARPLSEKQIAAAERIVAGFEREAARRNVAAFIGQPGERLEFDLVFRSIYSEQIDYMLTRYSLYMRTPEGSTVLYKGGKPSSTGMKTVPYGDDYIWPENQRVRVMATVKRHYTSNKGEPVTVIQRPKLIEVLHEGDLPAREEA